MAIHKRACADIHVRRAQRAKPIDLRNVSNPVLTKNALYEAGPLPPTTCDELPIEPHDSGQARAYIDEVIRCLENTWGPYLKKAGLPYEPVKVRYVKRLPKNYCGSDEEGSRDSEVWYCDWDRTATTCRS
ncbi:hypothetical protein [Nonomuraea sp. 10N515B]|uniref:hypothetical protein n=1 Tax=Nonomuraea sp. 10N515B TaxID=3457422 RepID=UPI003FCDD675